MNYYNDNDPKAAAWLRELIREGCLPLGVVDERSIIDVNPQTYAQCHFFAGIGGWSYALQLTGWPADRPVWTGSCPCQPFSIAGKKLGVADPRHLWPAFLNLIRFCWPPVIFGEQVASKAGKVWLAGVRTDLEALGYRVGAADLCAAGCGAPHIRQRLFWVADRDGGPNKPRWGQEGRATDGRSGGLGDTDRAGRGEQSGAEPVSAQQLTAQLRGNARGLDDATNRRTLLKGQTQPRLEWANNGIPRPPSGLGDSESGGCGIERNETLEREGGYLVCPDWSRFELIWCRGNKTRRIESGTFPLAHGIPGRVGLLRGYGNAIVPALAAEFIKAYLEL